MDRFFYKFNLKKQGEKRKESLRCLSFSLSLLQLASSMLRKVGARCKQSQLKKNTLIMIQRKIIQTKLITRIIFFSIPTKFRISWQEMTSRRVFLFCDCWKPIIRSPKWAKLRTRILSNSERKDTRVPLWR